MPETQDDIDRESYLSLADEMNDPDVGPWDPDDWDPQGITEGQRYAKKHGLPWPPRMGDYDRWCEQHGNT